MANDLLDGRPVHSKIGASSYYRWKACPGSVRLCAHLKGTESEYARIGTLAHGLAGDILEGKAFDPKTYEELTEEDREAVATYVDFVKSLAKPGILIMIEHKFDLTKVYPGLYGTGDCVLWNSDMQKLVIIDYKHGAGLPVEVENNKQLLYYGLGALMESKLPATSIELIIVQPRCFHKDGPIRRWSTVPARMFDFVADLQDDARATENPNAPLHPGEHCRFCPAAAMHCPAVREKSLALAKEVFSPVIDYDPKKLSEALGMLSTMESWIKGVREFAYREAQNGRIPPGYKLVDKRANRKWIGNPKPDNLAQEFGLKSPDVYEIKLKSPAQVEKIIPKHLAPVLERLTVKESSGKNLVLDSDPRPAINNSALGVFDVIE